jgi:O-antigen/teichoic acid export membrane protein
MASKLKGFIGETIIYGFANVFSRVFAMLLIPFYANYLGKVDYSNLVMLQSIFTILTFLLALNTGVFFYYYEYENPKYRKIVFTSWFYYELVLSLIFILLLLVSSSGIKNLLIVNSSNSFELVISILLIGLQLIPYTFNNTNINLFRIDRKPKKVMVIVFIEAFLTLIFVYFTLYIFHLGLIGVMLGQIAARTIIALAFARTAQFYIKFRNFSSRLLKKIVLYTWPFFIISIFGWVITSMDKFIGTRTLTDKTDVALLSLAMQLVIPIAVLADMIRMAVGPFVMSIHKDANADKTYQQVFDLSIFAASAVVVVVIGATPILTLLLTNQSFLSVIYVVPLMAMASIFSLAANQFSISFNLVKKNTIILYATVIAGFIGIIINYLFMKKWGFVVSGFSQLASYIVMGAILFIVGRKVANLKIKLLNSFLLLAITTFFVCIAYTKASSVIEGNYVFLIVSCCVTMILLTIVYIKSQGISIKSIVATLSKKLK